MKKQTDEYIPRKKVSALLREFKELSAQAKARANLVCDNSGLVPKEKRIYSGAASDIYDYCVLRLRLLGAFEEDGADEQARKTKN